MDTPNGLAYRIPAVEREVVCIGECMMQQLVQCVLHVMTWPTLFSLVCQIVFGFFQDSFSGMEQGPGHVVQAGYQKGAAQAGQNLIFSVVDTPGTASEFTSS